MAVDLGFIDLKGELLDSRFFPSKVGGKPSWLDFDGIPHTEKLTCKNCYLPMHFLCQLYCPINDKPYTFHRTLFVFFCTSKQCFGLNSGENFIVLRSQLCKQNAYYPDTPPITDVNWRPDISPSKFNISLCSACGLRGSIKCGKCDDAFCSLSHHEMHLSTTHVENVVSNLNRVLLSEFGIAIEKENNSDVDTSSEDSDFEYEIEHPAPEADGSAGLYLEDNNQYSGKTIVEDILEKHASSNDDQVFLKFSLSIAGQPKQIIRYGRDTNPLWLSKKHVPSANSIPSCEHCGCDRVFEFQILPQLLNYLNLDDNELDCAPGILDWGTLATYTCKNSCNDGPAYKKEFLWKQDITN